MFLLGQWCGILSALSGLMFANERYILGIIFAICAIGLIFVKDYLQ